MLFADRVKESSTSTGTGNFTLAGALTGFQSFNSAFGVTSSSNPFYYCIMAVDGTGNPTGQWEVGRGHLSASTTLVRDSIISNSSGTTSAISFSAGTSHIFGDFPAAAASGLLFSAFASIGNGADTTEDILQTYTLPGGTLAINGQALRIRGRAQFSSTTATKTLKLYFGATVIATFFVTTSSASPIIDFDVMVMRSGSTAQLATAVVAEATNNTTAATVFQEQNASAETLSGNVVIKVTGQSSVATANSVTCDLLLVQAML